METYKKLAKPVAIVAAIIVAAIVAASLMVSAKYIKAKGTVYIAQSGLNVVIIPWGGLRYEIKGQLQYSTSSLDGTIAAALIGEGDYARSGHTLYYITDTPKRIASGIGNYSMSASGNAIAYYKNPSGNRNDPRSPTAKAEFWLYSRGVNRRLTYDFSVSNYRSSAISPDGTAVAYTIYDGGSYKGMIWYGKASEIGRDMFPFAISNNAEYVYYAEDGSFYVQNGTDKRSRELLGKGESIGYVHGNRDLTQIAYSIEAKAYISRDGGGAEPLSGSIRSFAMPSGTVTKPFFHGMIHPVANFSQTFYRNASNSIVFIDGDYESGIVAKDVVGTIFLSSDGRTLTYIKDNSIYRVSAHNGYAVVEQTVRDKTLAFVATADGKSVYYVDDRNSLWHQNGGGKAALITTKYPTMVDDGDSLNGLFDGHVLYYVIDGVLYSATGGKGEPVYGMYGKTGGKGQPVHGISGEFLDVVADYYSVTATAAENGRTVTYRSSDGKDFTVMG